jgi:hypothetical protein
MDKDFLKKGIKKRLRDLIAIYGSANGIAKATGFQQTTINEWAAGHRVPSQALAMKFCEKLGLSEAWFWRGEGSMLVNDVGLDVAIKDGTHPLDLPEKHPLRRLWAYKRKDENDEAFMERAGLRGEDLWLGTRQLDFDLPARRFINILKRLGVYDHSEWLAVMMGDAPLEDEDSHFFDLTKKS